MKFYSIPIIILFACLLGCSVKINEEEPIVESIDYSKEELNESIQLLKEFTEKLDSEDYDTWNLVSVQLQGSVNKAKWILMLKTMRLATGRLESRGDVEFFCTEELPDAPKGRYFVFDVNSDFEKIDGRERIVTVFENDEWKIAGYFFEATIFEANET